MKILENQKFWKKVNVGLIILGLMLVVGVWQRPDNKLRLVFCDVGQGDASLVSWGSYQILVDGGPDNSVLLCLGKNMAFWDKKIEVIALTHPQADHMTGLIEVIKRYEVGVLVVSEMVNDTAEFWELRKAVFDRGVEIRELIKGDELRLGLVKFKVLWPEKRGGNNLAWERDEENKEKILGAQSQLSDVNEVSLVLKGSFKGFDWLLTGDIDEKIEREMEVSEVEVLKVAHHGSKYSSGEEWLKTIDPELGVISVGKRNRFGHPTKVVLDRLNNVGAKVLRTDELGTIKIISDGKSWWQE